MASYRNENRPDSGTCSPGSLPSLLVSPVWPIGLILCPKADRRFQAQSLPPPLMISSGREALSPARRECPAPSGRRLRWGGSMWPQARQAGPVNLDRGRGLTVWGIVLTVIFGIALTGFPAVAMSGGFPLRPGGDVPGDRLFGGGLAMIWAGTQRTKKAKRFRKYLALIGGGRASPSPPGPGHAGVGAQGL